MEERPPRSVLNSEPLMFRLAFCIGLLGALASGQPTDEAQRLSRQRDIDVLRDTPPVEIGGGVNDFKLEESTYRKLLYDTLTQYNIPVKWSAKPNPTTGPPTIFLENSPERTRDLVSVVLKLQVVDKVVLTRAKRNRTILAVVWEVVDGGYFPPSDEKEETQKIIRRLAEKFCLSYLAANRR